MVVAIKNTHFCVKNLKMKRKKNNTILTLRSGDLNPRFSGIFPPMIWIFMESEWDKIKSKQSSKRDKTLPKIEFFVNTFWTKILITSHCELSEAYSRKQPIETIESAWNYESSTTQRSCGFPQIPNKLKYIICKQNYLGL